MAELEAEAGAAATYFLMTRSEFYNLASPSGEAAIERLRELGHRVGLHAVWPQVDRDERFDPVLAWHNPDPEYMREPVEGFVERDGGAPGPTSTAPTRTSTGARAARTRSSAPARSSGSSC